GKKLDVFYTNHFTRLEALDNKTKRSLFKCNFCGDDPNSQGRAIEHRDNRLANHITSTTECPNATQAARSAAHLLMKAKKSGDTEVTGSGTGAEATKPAKKRKHQSDLDSVVDRPMSEAQQNSANRKLFKLFIHANIPFNTADNIFLSDFTNELRPSFKPAS
ncbi:hypothetical protein F5050DRAFT_1547890, partial [Lentinula boryana]